MSKEGRIEKFNQHQLRADINKLNRKSKECRRVFNQLAESYAEIYPSLKKYVM